MFRPIVSSPWLLATIAILVVVRIGGLFLLPDTGFPDRHLYLAYAETMLEGTAWLHHMATDPLPVTGFRAIGYPAVLAFAKILAGVEFGLLVRVLQAVVSILACIAAYRAVRSLSQREWVAAVAVLGYGTSVGLAYELSYLPDSLSISAWILVMAISLHAGLEGRGLSTGQAVLLGLCGLVIIAMRGNGLHLLALTAPVLLLGLSHQNGLRRKVTCLALIFLPALAFHGAVSEWNKYRTGERFFTTGAQIALVQPVFEMARRGAEPFQGEDPYAVAIRTHAPDLLYAQIYDANLSLYVDHQLTPKQIADLNTRHYIATVLDNPGAFLSMFFANFDDKFAMGLINPAFGLHEAYQLTTDTRLMPGFSKIVKNWDGTVASLAYGALYAIGMVSSAILFLAAVIGVPIRLWRKRQDKARWILALWLICGAVVAYYSALFVELRYLIMLNPFLAALGLWAILPSWDRDQGMVDA